MLLALQFLSWGSSPRVRGEANAKTRQDILDGIIPAGAGRSWQHDF